LARYNIYGVAATRRTPIDSWREKMGQLTLVVEFEIAPGKQAEFEAAIRSHARSCLAEEPGCLRFEVNYPLDEEGNRIPNRMMANELFADQQALLNHRATTRWVQLSERFKTLLANRRPILAELDK
jgi:autoinducer 2-degrading protein